MTGCLALSWQPVSIYSKSWFYNNSVSPLGRRGHVQSHTAVRRQEHLREPYSEGLGWKHIPIISNSSSLPPHHPRDYHSLGTTASRQLVNQMLWSDSPLISFWGKMLVSNDYQSLIVTTFLMLIWGPVLEDLWRPHPSQDLLLMSLAPKEH